MLQAEYSAKAFFAQIGAHIQSIYIQYSSKKLNIIIVVFQHHYEVTIAVKRPGATNAM